MISQRLPWWMYVVAASFLLAHLLQAYTAIWGPAFPQGLDGIFEQDAMRVRSVEPETLFARGGLEPGDRIVAVGSLPIRSPREWSVALANVEAERPEIWHVLRNGNPIELTVIFPGATWENRIHSGVVEYCAVNFSIFLFGIFIGF